MRKLFLWVLALALSAQAAVAAPLYEVGNDTPPASITNATGNLSGTAATVTLTAPSRHLIIKTDPAAAVAYIDFSGTATTADFRIDPGGSLTIDGPILPSFSIIGATATGTYSVCAW